METGPRFIVPSDGLEKPGIESATPGLQSEWHNHCTTEASLTYLAREYTSVEMFKNCAHVYNANTIANKSAL